MPTYNVSRIGSIEDGVASECSLFVMPDGSSVAAASRNQNGYVTLTIWTLQPDGSLQQYSQTDGDSQAGVRITGVAVGEYVTAGMSTAGGHIRTKFWRAGQSIGDADGTQGT